MCAAKINGEMSGVKAAVSGGIASQLWIVVFKFEAFSETSPYPRFALFVDRLLVIKQHLTMMIIFSNFNILSNFNIFLNFNIL